MERTIAQRAAELASHYGEEAGPTVAQWQRMLAGPVGSPITVINLFKLRADGLEAMMRYGAVSGPTVAKVGGRFLLTGPFETTFIGDEEPWDLVAIASYPNRAALLALFDDDAYRAAWADRAAAVERQRVVIAAG